VQGWHKDSYARTEEFRNHGPRAPTTWVLVDGPDKIPKSALEAGRDKDDHPIYIARAYYEDGIRTFEYRLFGGVGFQALMAEPHPHRYTFFMCLIV
jgi:hypothetical protein